MKNAIVLALNSPYFWMLLWLFGALIAAVLGSFIYILKGSKQHEIRRMKAVNRYLKIDWDDFGEEVDIHGIIDTIDGIGADFEGDEGVDEGEGTAPSDLGIGEFSG